MNCMRANTGIFILICLLFLVGTVGAAVVPDTVIVTTNKPWIIANNVDQSTVTVTVMNTTPSYSGQPLQEATVDLTVSDTYGTLSTTPISTDSSGKGKVSSTFKVKTKSGAAQITATITSPELSNSTIQNIDHEVPVKANLQYPFEGEVASNVTFKISIIDRWGNPIDGRNTNENHTISLAIFGPSDDCGFFDSNGVFYPNTLQSTLDINGNRSLQVRLSKIVGDNNIQIASKYTFTEAVIRGISTDVPYRMTGSFAGILHQNRGLLANDEVRANNEDFFILEYFLYDVYGNPVQTRSIGVRTNLTDELTQKYYTTNSLGQIQVKYGPKISILTANITAIANNTAGSVNKTFIVKFISSEEAENLLLIITPQTMASWDSDPLHTTREATVVGSLTDAWGNPLNGKKVTFTISNIVTAPYTKTADYTGDPRFESGSTSLTKDATTDNGYASIKLYPGAFVTGGPGYSDSATGSCDVTATYIDSDGKHFNSAPVKVEWKNFAYLSVTVNATPQLVRVNETIDVTIQITGDGYKMVNNPITVILDMDASDSMNGQAAAETNGLDRFDNSIIAAKQFVASMDNGDMVGVVSHGNISNDLYWTPVSDLSFNPIALNNSISSMVKHGGTSGPNAISMNQSLYAAADKILLNPLYHAGEIDAIITISDSPISDTELGPAVQKTGGNNIRVFSILYVSNANECDSQIPARNIKLLDNRTNGKYYCAQSIQDVIQNLTEIKQVLSTIAGVNTAMNLDFSNVPVNSTPMVGGDVFDYVPINAGLPGEYINHTKLNVDEDGRTSIIWTDGNQSVVDQSDDWTAPNNYQLKFNVGTIHIDETWKATFRLKAKQEGLIQLFGPGSTISYNGGNGSLNLPATYINSLNASTPLGLGSGVLDLSNLIVPGTATDSIPVQWNISYSGFATATETVSYSYNNKPWVIFATRIIPPTSGDIIEYAQLNVQGVNGDTYRIKVRADTPDAGFKELVSGTITVGKAGATLRLK